MYFKGFVILLVCLGLGNAVRLSNYMRQENTEDDDVTTRGSEYKKPIMDEEVTTTEESITSSEKSSEETTKVKGNKKQQAPTEQAPTEQDTSEQTPTEETTTEEKQTTSTEPNTEEKPSKETQVDETQVDETQEEENQEKETTATASESTTEKSPSKESKPQKENSSKKPFIGKKCSFNKEQVEKTFSQWCDGFKKKNYPKLLKMYAKDGHVIVLGDTYHLHIPEELNKLLAALKILETTFNVKACEDFISSHESFACDPKTKTASMNGKMKTVKFDPPITGTFKEILTEEDGQLKIYSQELDISDERK